MAESEPIEHGYEADFVPELDKKYVCPVCLAALRDPVQTKCGHRFCQNCFKGSARKTRYAKCPVDNTWLDTQKEVFADNAVRREVMSLITRCPHQADGCTWQGELRDMKKHEDECPETEVACPNNCHQVMRRKEMEEHQLTCRMRVIKCIHCGNSVVHQDMTKHQVLVCMKFPVTCTVCGQTGILREDIPPHVDLITGDCPLVTVRCAFYHIGCYFQDKRQNMGHHYQDSFHVHMMLMSAKLMEQEERSVRQRSEVREATETCARLSILTQEQQNQLEQHQQLISQQQSRIEELLTTSFTGSILWTVDMASSTGPYTSPAFYTGCPGYKLQVTMDTDGYMALGETYISMAVRVLQGHYDSGLQLPLRCVCRIILLDQSHNFTDRKPHLADIYCDGMTPCSSEVHAQTSQTVLHKFIKKSVLMSERYMQNGKVSFQVTVDLTGLPPAGQQTN